MSDHAPHLVPPPVTVVLAPGRVRSAALALMAASIGLGASTLGCRGAAQRFCLADSDCGAGEICTAGACAPDPCAGGGCGTTGDASVSTTDPSSTNAVTLTTSATTTTTTTVGDSADSSSEGGTTDDPTTDTAVPQCNDKYLERVATLLGNILGSDPDCDDWEAEFLAQGNATQHSDGVQSESADGEVDFIRGGVVLPPFDVEDIPCGPGDGFLVLCTPNPEPIAGPVVIIHAGLAAPLPLDNPTDSYQFGFVFDRDNDPADNYVPSPAYPGDFFANTDQWNYTTYVAGEAWYTWSSTSEAGFANVPSSGRIVLAEDIVMLIIAQSEIDPTVATHRITAFRHEGDYGTSLPWSGDVVPAVGEPLTPTE